VWILSGEIIQFCSVFLKAIEFPVGFTIPEEFPFAYQNGFGLTELPIQYIVSNTMVFRKLPRVCTALFIPFSLHKQL